jgi:hypothetical protein
MGGNPPPFSTEISRRRPLWAAIYGGELGLGKVFSLSGEENILMEGVPYPAGLSA